MYHIYNQNNPGGHVIRTDQIGDVVVVKCPYDRADLEKIGIYFDGASKGKDCECCGDRWSRYYRKAETLSDVKDKVATLCKYGTSYAVIHYPKTSEFHRIQFIKGKWIIMK